jgi:MtN3 and saliva related transmembrane protein
MNKNILEIKYIMIRIIIATLAPIVNCIQLFPQLYKTYKTKSVKDLSFYSLLLILTTNILWLLHGYFIFDISLIIAGVVSMIINIALLTLYLLYRKKRYL